MAGSVQSVERAAAILELLAGESAPTPLAHIASSLGLAKGTAHGLVQTLRQVGFVDQDEVTGRYAVGAALLQLGATSLDPNELRARALNWADALASRCGEAVLLGTLGQGHLVIAHHVFRTDATTQKLRTGTTSPLHCSALGKVLLAHDPRAVRMLGCELASHTYRTITDHAQLQRELAGVRDVGWAAEVEEREPDRAAVAAPVRDGSGFVVAAVAVEGAVDAVCDSRHRPRQALAGQVMATARAISRELGHGRQA